MKETSAEGGTDHILHALFDHARGNAYTMVEVGAAGPDFLSVGELFRRADWNVIAIEPNPLFAAQHRAKGNKVMQYAASSVDEDDVNFNLIHCNNAEYNGETVTYESFSSLGITPDLAASLAKTPHLKTRIRVDTRTLDTLVGDLPRIDLLVVDVEGWELPVMRGLTLHNPTVVVVEDHFANPELHQHMLDRGYLLWKSIPRFANNIYVHKQGGNTYDRVG